MEELFDSEVKMHKGNRLVYKNSTKKSLDLEVYGQSTSKAKRTIFNQINEDCINGESEFTIEKLTDMVGTKVLHCANRLLTLRSGSHCQKAENKDVLFRRLIEQLHG